MNTFRVLQVTDNLNRGGQETFIMNVYRNIDRTKVQFDFLISEKEKCDYEDEITDLGGRVYRTVPKTSGFLNFLRITNHLLRTNQADYKVVHIHTSSQLNAVAWLFTDILKIPCKILHSHSSMSNGDAKGKLRSFLSFIIYRFFTHRYACSEVAGDWLFGKADKKAVNIVRNGVDAAKFSYNEQSRMKIREELKMEDNFVVGHIGRFSREKNHTFLIDVFHELYKLNDTSRLILVGVGELEETIREKVKELGLEDVVLFLGMRTDIYDIMSAIDIFVLPSLYEGLPLVGIEAQASGVRMIISDAITRELDITGLVEYVALDKSPKEWAEMLLPHKEGYERRSTYSTIVSAGYDIKTIAAELEASYLNMIRQYNKEI